LIYEPSDDTYLLMDSLPNNTKGMAVLEVGTGSGIIAEEIAKRGAPFVLATDVSFEAALSAKSRGLEVVVADLLSALNDRAVFDLVLFNPPYLPSSPRSNSEAWTGGIGGWELSFKFLAQAKYHTKPNGKILMVLSSLTSERILKGCADLGLAFERRACRDFFYESLCVYEFREQRRASQSSYNATYGFDSSQP